MANGVRRKLTARDVVARKGGPPLTMITAYDYPIARLVETAGIDLILVGDSLGMTVLGYDTPTPVMVDEIVYHCRAVVRGAPNTHVVADMPFLSYHAGDAQALENAGRLIQEGGADAVKLEGGRGAIAGRIATLVGAGVPVMGHIGLTPQTGGTGGFGLQGADRESALAIVADAEAVAAAGAYAMVVEAVPAELARLVTERVGVPTIGIGAGPDCDRPDGRLDRRARDREQALPQLRQALRRDRRRDRGSLPRLRGGGPVRRLPRPRARDLARPGRVRRDYRCTGRVIRTSCRHASSHRPAPDGHFELVEKSLRPNAVRRRTLPSSTLPERAQHFHSVSGDPSTSLGMTVGRRGARPGSRAFRQSTGQPASSNSNTGAKRSIVSQVLGSRTTWTWAMPAPARSRRNAAISSGVPVSGVARGSGGSVASG